MSIYICTNVYVPLRISPSHRSEMGSQILMGESFEIIETAGSYSRIRLLFDGYSGWVDNDHMTFSIKAGDESSSVIATDLSSNLADGSSIQVPAGAEVKHIDNINGTFSVGSMNFSTGQEITTAPSHKNPAETALRYLNTPYLWGGRTSMGIDCSGLVQTVYKVNGINIPRDSFKQAESGVTIDLLSDALPGDLLFFDNNEGKITHVGMLYKPGVIIHASGKVRLDIIDHQGIFRKEDQRYSHRLRIIKRIVNN